MQNIFKQSRAQVWGEVSDVVVLRQFPKTMALSKNSPDIEVSFQNQEG